MTDDELDRMRAYAEAARGPWPSYQEAYAQDVPRLLATIDVLRANVKWWASNDNYANQIRHRLRFAEMVLDRIGAEVDGVPWREAARLSESLEGEPVTEPVAVLVEEHEARRERWRRCGRPSRTSLWNVGRTGPAWKPLYFGDGHLQPCKNCGPRTSCRMLLRHPPTQAYNPPNRDGPASRERPGPGRT